MAIAIRSNGQISYPFLAAGAFTAALAARETGPAGAPEPRLLEQVREAISTRHYSHRTEKAYIHWIKRYIFFKRLTGRRRRHHLQESVLQRALKDAVRGAGIAKHATCHTFRHSLPPTCWKRATISAPYRSCSVTPTSAPR